MLALTDSAWKRRSQTYGSAGRHPRPRTRFLFIAALALGIDSFATAQSAPESAPAPAPVLNASASVARDMGVWDDVFVASDQGMMLLLRGDTLFTLGDSAEVPPSKLVSHSALAGARVVACADVGERRWIFLDSTERTPFALDVGSGTVAAFPIPGLRIAAKQTPVIQAFIIAPHLGAAVFMVSGGDRETWPRPENRPLYFWMGLKSGRVVDLPVGWDLRYYTADQSIAVFNAFTRDKLDPQALDLSSGEVVRELPNLSKTPYTEFHWNDKWSIMPIVGGEDHHDASWRSWLAGLAVKGTVFPFDLGLRDARLQDVKANDGFAGFRVRPGIGLAPYDPGDLWLMALKPGARPELVAQEVTDVVMLGAGACVFRTGQHARRQSEETYLRTRISKTPWSVLDGVERLPPLASEAASRERVIDCMSVTLVAGFGGVPQDAKALCSFRHLRDEPGRPVPGEWPPVAWSRLVVVSTNGQRHVTEGFPQGRAPDELWFHNSGRVLTGKYSWYDAGLVRKHRLHLVETPLDLATPR